MSYKDPDKQREANRQAQARFKAKGITSEGITDRVLPDKEWAENQHISLETDCLINTKPKRGKDIKVFSDLPPDVQRTIHKLCMQSTGLDEAEFKRRIAIAIQYQHSTGI